MNLPKIWHNSGFPGGPGDKEPAWQGRRQNTRVWLLGWEDPLKEMTMHSSILAWEIPRTEELAGYSL